MLFLNLDVCAHLSEFISFRLPNGIILLKTGTAASPLGWKTARLCILSKCRPQKDDGKTCVLH